MPAKNFAHLYRDALANPHLQRALSNATNKAAEAREASAANLGVEWERLRTRAHAIKEHTINNLDYYVEEFAANVERSGGHVFWAFNAEEANRYITGVAHSEGVRLVVKGKSMMSEEIELNNALAAANVEVVETDLGEYIVQLAGQHPSHINMPAIHLSRSEISDLFTRKLNVDRTEKIEELASTARRLLRERFTAAEMGITGVNFAVAETGTIVLIENEGNIRLTTSLPRVHIALMGIEKVIPRLADLEVFLALLPRSASGQKITSNVSLLTGVKSLTEEEGPEQLHVVILDNGRVKILADPKLRESLFCIRCGACLNVCPVYQRIGGHAYGSTYSGPIGAVLTPQLIGRERAADLPFASTLCGACRDACPIKINLPAMLLHLRHEINEPDRVNSQSDSVNNVANHSRLKVAHSLRRFAARTGFKLWATAMKNSCNYSRASRLARRLTRGINSIRGNAIPTVLLRRWTKTRNLPPLATRSFREQWPEAAKSILREKKP